jgi:hypothetical protein
MVATIAPKEKFLEKTMLGHVFFKRILVMIEATTISSSPGH